MRLILICLAALLLLIQLPLWLGKGGWLHVWDLDQQVQSAHRKNDELRARNAKLASEVQDLKQGTGAVEERARFELGMIKNDEIFVQILDANTSMPPPLPVKPKILTTPAEVKPSTASPSHKKVH